MDINLLRLRSRLTNANDVEEQNDLFIKRIFGHLPVNFVDKRNNDFSLLLIETGGTEEFFIQLLPNLMSPIYLLTNGDNNSLAASLEILTYLKSHNYEGEIIHGDDEYIIKRLTTLFNLKTGACQHRLGVVGHPSDWLIASDIDQLALHNVLHCDLIEIPFQEFKSEIDKHQYVDNELTLDLKKHKFNQVKLEEALDIYGALKRLIQTHDLCGLTVRCFDLLGEYQNTSCLALALLNAEGIIATCEGDETSMVTMMLIKLLTGLSSFQVNPSRIDLTTNTGVFAHCSVPLNMISSYELDTHFESGLGVAIHGKMHLQPITLIKAKADLSDIFMSEGTIVENLEDRHLCRTQIKVRFDDSIAPLLSNPYGNHHILVYGHIKEIVKKWLVNL